LNTLCYWFLASVSQARKRRAQVLLSSYFKENYFHSAICTPDERRPAGGGNLTGHPGRRRRQTAGRRERVHNPLRQGYTAAREGRSSKAGRAHLIYIFRPNRPEKTRKATRCPFRQVTTSTSLFTLIGRRSFCSTDRTRFPRYAKLNNLQTSRPRATSLPYHFPPCRLGTRGPLWQTVEPRKRLFQ
jgi:hypothetical protein